MGADRPTPAPTLQAQPGGSRDIVELYRAYSQRIYRYCCSQLGNRADAEDATQDTFIRVAPQLDRLSGDPLAYLTAVAHNVCYDMRRSTRRRAVLLDDVVKIDANPGPDVQAVERALLTRAWVALNRQEKSLLAHTYAGFTYDEISRLTGLSAKAVSVGICRARKRVRQVASAVAAILGPAAVARAMVRGARRASTGNAGPLAAMAASADPVGLVVATLVAGVIALPALSTHPATPPVDQRVVATMSLHAADRLPGASLSGAGAGAAPVSNGSNNHGGASLPGRPSAGVGPLAVAPTAASPVGVVGQDARPQSTYFDSMAVSPDYANDHTIFASGWISVGCNAGQCPALFVSHDGGGSWTQAGRTGYQHGPVLLPPGYPTVPTLFVASDTAGLLRSDDAGQTFRPVLPVAGVAALSPASTPGDAQVLMVPTSGGQTLLYQAGTSTVVPGPSVPPQFVPTSAVYAGDAHHVLIGGGLMSSPTALPTPEILLCDDISCAKVFDFTAADHLPVSLHSARSVGGGLIVASTAEQVSVSHDDGQSFAAPLTIAGQTATSAVSEQAAGSSVLVASTVGAGPSLGSVLSRSSDAGASLQAVPTDLSAGTTIHALLPLPDGRLLAGVVSSQAGDQFGVWCSRDGGSSWADSC